MIFSLAGWTVSILTTPVCPYNTKYRSQWLWLCSNKTLFVVMEMWISHTFHIWWTIFLLLILPPTQPLKAIKTIWGLWAIQKQEVGWVWPVGHRLGAPTVGCEVPTVGTTSVLVAMCTPSILDSSDPQWVFSKHSFVGWINFHLSYNKV